MLRRLGKIAGLTFLALLAINLLGGMLDEINRFNSLPLPPPGLHRPPWLELLLVEIVEIVLILPLETLGRAVPSAVFLVPLVTLYSLPTVIAHTRQRRNAVAITVLSVCFGWTLLGWVIALIWALVEDASPKKTAAALE